MLDWGDGGLRREKCGREKGKGVRGVLSLMEMKMEIWN